MSSVINYLYFIGAITLIVNAAHLPDTFKICKKSDPNYKKCINAAVEGAINQLKDGLPSLNIPKIEPLFIEKMHIGGNGGSVDIEQDYTNLYIHGFSNAIIESIELLLDGDQCLIKINSSTPSLRLDGDYKMTGKILVLQINGFGGANITLTNLKSVHAISCEKVGNKDGKQILKLGDYKMDIATDKIKYDFQNLVNGNPELSAEVTNVLNDNSLEVFEGIRSDYSKTFAEILKRIATFILGKVPYEEYYLE